MSAEAVTLVRADARPAPVGRSYRFELVKLLAQWPVRLTLCGETGARTWSSTAGSAWQRLRKLLAPAAPSALLESL